MPKIISLDQKLKRVTINAFELENSIVFEYFNSIPDKDRDDKLYQSIYIGVLAQMENRLSAFLSKTQNELGTELESLKMIFEMKKEIFFKTAVKGMVAEDEIAAFLNQYFQDKKWKDSAEVTGTQNGKLDGNKTGDVVCKVDGNEDKRIALEVKFDKQMKLGDIADKDVFTKKTDYAWSQIIEAKANRDGKVGLIIFDVSLVDNSILNYCDSVGFVQGVGFIVVVDSQRGDYSNLVIAYNLARDIVLHAKDIKFDDKVLTLILKRIIKDIESVLNIRKLVEGNIKNNQEILKELEKAALMMEFNQTYLTKFLSDGKLTQEDLLSFYSGEEVKDKFKPIEADIKSLAV